LCDNIILTAPTRKEGHMATSKRDASKAAKLLRDPKVPKGIKSVAGSDLSQKKGRKRR
jgi:hypothetical protein